LHWIYWRCEMTSKNLWGDLSISEDDIGRSPKQILTDQANQLMKATSSILRARVESSSEYKQITHDLVIIAPYLNNYEVSIARASHFAVTYPVRLFDLVADELIGEFQNEDEFTHALGKILSSKKVGTIVGSLLSQSPRRPAKSAGPPGTS
jgi:hypothetical protein